MTSRKTLLISSYLIFVVVGCATGDPVSSPPVPAADPLPAPPKDALPVLPADLLNEQFAPVQPLVTRSSAGEGTYLARFPLATQRNPTGASMVLACVAAYVAHENDSPGFRLLGGFSRDAEGYFIAPFSIDPSNSKGDQNPDEISATGSACAGMLRPKYQWD